jgi:hypothetical protein
VNFVPGLAVFLMLLQRFLDSGKLAPVDGMSAGPLVTRVLNDLLDCNVSDLLSRQWLTAHGTRCAALIRTFLAGQVPVGTLKNGPIARNLEADDALGHLLQFVEADVVHGQVEKDHGGGGGKFENFEWLSEILSFLRVWRPNFGVVVRRIREWGFEDSNLFANFAGEGEDSNPKAKDSNLCCKVKRTQNCSKSSKLGQLLACVCGGNCQPKIYAI